MTVARRIVTGCLLWTSTLVVGLLVSEAAYRVYLYVRAPAMFRPREPSPYVPAYNVSHWEFDQDFGYVYPTGRVIDVTGVVRGRVKNCHRLTINRYGNIGHVVGRYEDADLKILVFGDSWAAFPQQGRTWPLALQEVLEARLGRKVHVVNFGRDGYGVLQMFDLAAAKIPEWKPDLAIIAFISDDLTRARSWRTVVGDGDDVRVLTTVDPVRHPDLSRAADTMLLMPSATHDWCRRMAGSQTTDPVLERLIAKYHRLLAEGGRTRAASLTTMRHAYLYDRLVRRDAFAELRRTTPASVNPRVSFESYGDDARFRRSVERVRATGVPFILFHLAYYPEIKARREYLLGPQEDALLRSLEQLTEKTVWRTTEYVAMPVEQPERMNVTPDDFHPSTWGMEFYARAVADALVRNGALPATGPGR